MTIDVVTKAGAQIGISILPEELNASETMQRVLSLLLIGAEAAEAEHRDVDPTPARSMPQVKTVLLAKKTAPAKESTPKNPRALEIDKGKICALWKSGSWSVKDIAADVHCSEQTVRNTLQARGLWKTDEAEADIE